MVTNYDLGEDFNITTPRPETTTAMIPDEQNGIKIYILPVNEDLFYPTQFSILINELTAIAEQERCELLNGPAMSCRQECHLSQDPDRGCISVIVGLKYNPLICKMTTEQFAQEIEAEVNEEFSTFYIAL